MFGQPLDASSSSVGLEAVEDERDCGDRNVGDVRDRESLLDDLRRVDHAILLRPGVEGERRNVRNSRMIVSEGVEREKPVPCRGTVRGGEKCVFLLDAQFRHKGEFIKCPEMFGIVMAATNIRRQ